MRREGTKAAAQQKNSKMITVRMRIGRMMYGRIIKTSPGKIILPSIILRNTLLQSESRVVR